MSYSELKYGKDLSERRREDDEESVGYTYVKPFTLLSSSSFPRTPSPSADLDRR